MVTRNFIFTFDMEDILSTQIIDIYLQTLVYKIREITHTLVTLTAGVSISAARMVAPYPCVVGISTDLIFNSKNVLPMPAVISRATGARAKLTTN